MNKFVIDITSTDGTLMENCPEGALEQLYSLPNCSSFSDDPEQLMYPEGKEGLSNWRLINDMCIDPRHVFVDTLHAQSLDPFIDGNMKFGRRLNSIKL